MYLETGIRLWRWGNAVSCFGVLQFLVLGTLAMRWYPGGTLLERSTVGYSFFENYLSDLGRTMSWSGEPNTVACVLFNTAVVVLGLSLIPFFLFLPSHAPDRSLILWIAAVFGVGSACALIGIGLTPYDIRLEAHQEALFFWVASLLAAVVLHAWALLTSEEASSLFALLSLGLAVVVLIYILRGAGLLVALLFGSASGSVGPFITMQKYVVLSAVLWYFVFGARMVCTTELRPAARNVELRRAAERYLKRLQ
jgi:hypothetical membrane protein